MWLCCKRLEHFLLQGKTSNVLQAPYDVSIRHPCLVLWGLKKKSLQLFLLTYIQKIRPWLPHPKITKPMNYWMPIERTIRPITQSCCKLCCAIKCKCHKQDLGLCYLFARSCSLHTSSDCRYVCYFIFIRKTTWIWGLEEIYSCSMTQLNYKCPIRDCQFTSDKGS